MTPPAEPAPRARASSPAPRARPASVAWPAGLAAATLVLGFGIGLRQLARSNRPHELTAAPYVTLLLAASVALAALALWRLCAAWRDRGRHPLGPAHGILAAVLLPLAVVDVLLFLAAAGTAIEILAG